MKANNKQEVIDRIRRERDRLASFGIVGIGLFGSFAQKGSGTGMPEVIFGGIK